VGLLTELRRRKVFQVGLAYLAASWLLVEVVSRSRSIAAIAARYARRAGAIEDDTDHWDTHNLQAQIIGTPTVDHW
jgi:hypothetical protein